MMSSENSHPAVVEAGKKHGDPNDQKQTDRDERKRGGNPARSANVGQCDLNVGITHWASAMCEYYRSQPPAQRR